MYDIHCEYADLLFTYLMVMILGKYKNMNTVIYPKYSTVSFAFLFPLPEGLLFWEPEFLLIFLHKDKQNYI